MPPSRGCFLAQLRWMGVGRPAVMGVGIGVRVCAGMRMGVACLAVLVEGLQHSVAPLAVLCIACHLVQNEQALGRLGPATP